MFERFTASARQVVREAVAHAELAGRGSVGEGELLLALLDRTGSPGADVLTALGLRERRASVEAALHRAHRRGGISASDAEALAGLGIDVEEIVARVEREHGAGALAAAGAPGPKEKRRGRLRRPYFTPEAKSVVERSLRVALGRGDKYIGDEHLLIALLGRPGLAASVLAEHGVQQADVLRVLAERQAEAG
ncbi:Clp protease N-terminal domain-containing protein [Streptomyces sp. MST-110588]|uniref:Clp protease N-terminal domain-containing protein n=1 Tax=Streptomyces sp. MST-110588 TaxID=2833628 RepID=UPI001F5DD769|nr:Clp protease N-terminal domain-containing protein [Streptomyces sp. MST-110588]UNO39971.1 peptidase [Streptomyces sp. MST-110588]